MWRRLTLEAQRIERLIVSLPARLRAWLDRGASERALADEIRHHVSEKTVRYVESGLSPDAARLASMVILARTGQAPATEAAATAMNLEEQRIALAEYQPFRYADQIPRDTAMLYLDGKADAINAAADFLAKSLVKAP